MSKAPWSHPLTERLDHLPKVRPTLNEAAKQVRNRLRRFSARSIVEHALTFLWAMRGKPAVEELRSWPWITLLIVKLVLEDEAVELDRGLVCAPEVFDRCRETLWNAQGSRDRKEESSGGVYLMMRSLVQVQLQFQQQLSWGFMRWPALLARLDSAHPSRRHFVERFGMEPDSFLCLSYAAHVPIATGSAAWSPEFLEPMRRRFGADVDRFVAEFAKDLPELRAELLQARSMRLTEGPKSRPREELNEFPWLAKYPLLRTANGSLVMWHPYVFTRGLEDAVHRRMSERRSDYASAFSKVFEAYVLELIELAGLSYLSEVEYKRQLSDAEKTVEAIFTDGEANVLIEAKLTAHSDDVALSNRAGKVWTGFKRVREAMQQGWMVSSRLRSGLTPSWPCTRAVQNFLIVVTSQPMLCATGEHFRRMFRHDVFDPEKLAARQATTPTLQQLELLPLANIVIASIEEFEHLMVAVRDGRIRLVPFLQEVASANADPRTSVMFLDQLIARYAAGGSPPPVIVQARERAEAVFRELL